MGTRSAYRFKIATEPWEFEAIHRLNYKTFVEEIPQHQRNAQRRLVDRFHSENTYAVCLDGRELIGMVCGRAKRPFSLDAKVPGLDEYLPDGRAPFEIRLLAVEKDHRGGAIFAALASILARHFREKGCDLALISGTTRQLKLYRRMGFVPFAGLVGTGEARFQPMYLELERFLRISRVFHHAVPASAPRANYLCGPVRVNDEVREAFAGDPVSHRSNRFFADFRATRRMLCALVGARNVQILLGSGTLANDVIAAELALTGGRGLVLSNGEFGERLADHAKRHHLKFDVVRSSWGEPLDLDSVNAHLAGGNAVAWIWAVHCETSTGVLNDLQALRAVCKKAGVKLCLDCISSVGTLPVDLRDIHLASCVSGKGLASFPGLSMVFYETLCEDPSDSLPRYLDLRYYAAQAGVPFTTSTNLVYALQAALACTEWAEKFARTAATSAWLRRSLRNHGFSIVAAEQHAAPGVLTLALDYTLSSENAGMHLRHEGFLVGYESAYLLRRNWIQIALMGAWCDAELESLVATLCRLRGGAGGTTARSGGSLVFSALG